MSTQFLLDEDDIKELTKLMLVMIETQESRKQLCRELGINPQEVSFIIGTSDDTFCTELIDCLNRYGYQEYLCKLCCDKLFPILNKSVYSHRISILKKIVEKLNCNCNQEKQNHPIPTVPNPDELKSESLFTKIGNTNKKLLACGAIIIIGLTGFSIGQSKTIFAGKPISAGTFKFANSPAIYYSDGQGHYCKYDTMDDFSRHNAPNTLRDLPGSLTDYKMTYDGVCRI